MAGARARVSAALSAVVGWRLFKPTVFVLCAIPGVMLGWGLYQALSGQNPSALTADPTKYLEHETGRTALMLLLFSLTVTPLRRMLQVNRIQTIRRMLGVWSFAYALMHVTVYLVFDQLCVSLETCQFPTIWEDLTKRPFIFVGMVAFTVLLVLAITSTMGWQRRLKKNWQRLHRLVYVAAVAAVVHFIWGQKSDISEPLQWGAFLLLLFGIRIFYAVRKRAARLVPAVSR